MDPLEFLIRDAASGRWLRFERPSRLLVAVRPDEVPRLLAVADSELAAGRWIAGFLAYEAAPGIDRALKTRVDRGFPSVVLGVFSRPTVVPPEPPPAPGEPAVPGPLRATVTRAAYCSALERIRAAIREGDTYQVNYTYRLRGRLESDPRDLFRHLVSGQAATYAAFLRFGRWAVASASPELHFRRTGDLLVSRPMKGTAARGATDGADRVALSNLLASRKERAENLMIVDMVRNDLSRVALPGSVRVPDLFSAEAYPTVWQLTSTVESRSDAPFSGLVQALFPAASITGAPKASTMALIAELESTPRRIYCGSIGFAGPDGEIQFNVAIRTALVDTETGRFEYGIGGGVVWDSDPEREWAESRTKARILRRPAVDFELLETLRWDREAGYALLDAHVDRLMASASALGFDADRRAVIAALDAAAGSFPPDAPRRVRLTVSRSGRVDVTHGPLTTGRAFDRPRLAIAPVSISSADPFFAHKTTHRAPYDAIRTLCPDADDVVLWNERGEVTETSWANLFVERDGTLFTPPLSSGPLAGTLRAALLDEGRAAERVLTPDDVLRAERVWLGNSVRGLYEAGAVTDGRPARPGTV